jgi:Galactose oxidase, central domain
LAILTPFTGRTGTGGIFTAELKSGTTPAANSMVTAVLSNGQTVSSNYSMYAKPTWSSFSAMGLAPSPRTGHAMAYAGGGQVLLFGGYNDTSKALGDTWLWNGGSWTRKPDAPTALGPRFGHSMAFNSDSGEVLLYNGEVDRPSELWRYKDGQWSKVTFGGAAPAGRSTAGLIYQPNRKRFLLFGGSTRGVTRGDAWEFDPGTLTWEPVPANLMTPESRRDFGMAYDTTRGIALVFGGTGGGQGTEVILGDTWRFSSGTWSKVPSAPMPASSSTMVFDAYRNRMVLFGGFAGSNLPRVSATWEFGSQWVFRPTSLTPSGRNGHAMAYDVERKKVVMFGGTDGTNAAPNTVFEYGP